MGICISFCIPRVLLLLIIVIITYVYRKVTSKVQLISHTNIKHHNINFNYIL